MQKPTLLILSLTFLATSPLQAAPTPPSAPTTRDAISEQLQQRGVEHQTTTHADELLSVFGEVAMPGVFTLEDFHQAAPALLNELAYDGGRCSDRFRFLLTSSSPMGANDMGANDEYVVRFEQEIDGYRIPDGHLTLLVDFAGGEATLRSVSGIACPLSAADWIATAPELDLIDIVAEAEAALGHPTQADLPAGPVAETNISIATMLADGREAEVSVELVFSTELQALQWRVADGQRSFHMQANAPFTSSVRHLAPGSSGSGGASIKRDHYNAGTSGDINSSFSAEVNSLLVTDWTGVGNPQRRRYNLQYTWGATHDIGPVLDYNSPEVTRTVDPGVVPLFNFCCGSANYRKQQNAYFFIRTARDYLVGNIANSVTPYNTNGIAEIWVDDPGFWCPGEAQACYAATYRSIYFKPNFFGAEKPFHPGLYYHEYGHHISALYGNFALWTCNSGSNEGASISEAVSDAYAMIFGFYYHSNFDYRNSWSGVVDSPHRSDPPEKKSGVCNDIYDWGDFFRQAMWEVLHNQDCSENSAACSISDIDGWGNRIGWTAPWQARVGLARSLAYATKVSGGNTTYDTFAFLMETYLKTNYGQTVADNFGQVMWHHGLTF